MNNQRIAKLRSKLSQTGAAAVLISNPVNVLYLSGFDGGSSWLVVTDSGLFLITDFRFIEQAKEQAPEWQLVKHEGRMASSLKEVLAETNVSQLGFESQFVSYEDYLVLKSELDQVELIPLTGIVEELRLRKDHQELESIKGAVRLADEAFKHIIKLIKPGVSETELAAELEYFFRKNGASKPSFDTIVGSGFRGAMPHGTASQKTVDYGELVILDYGAVYENYCSDMTRTVVVGKASKEQQKIYEIVLEAHITARDSIKPGMKCSDVDAIARKIIAGYGYGENFGHGLGHGVGLDIHEAPRLNIHCQTELAPGMVVTVEPGIYLPGWGGVRIEDMVLVTETGFQVLTQSEKALIEL